MIYDVSHKTTFEYETTVSISQHVLHLLPRAHDAQRRIRMSTECKPAPSVRSRNEDFFGNPIEFVTIQEQHDRLVVEARSTIEVFEQRSANDLESSAPWDELALQLERADGRTLNEYQYIFDSPLVRSDRQTLDYALPSFPAGRPVLEAVKDLTHRIFSEFEYKGGISDVSTPVGAVLEMRQGVCQDFAHLELACLRSLGLAARYVSGYLLTYPPDGQPKLQGADASHAWISVWTGDRWVDFDPTNDLVPSHEHITLAWGRDYGDVSPINGFVIGGGEHRISVAVDVHPMEAESY
jgi:transglutaminase-like putative cysteine protease